MPNDCWNVYTVVGTTDDLDSLYEEGLQVLRQASMTVTEEGLEDMDRLRVFQRRERGMRFVYKSRWNPNILWMEQMLIQYPSLWMKNEWSEESGRAGVVVGGVLYGRHYPLQEFRWDDVMLEDDFHPARRMF